MNTLQVLCLEVGFHFQKCLEGSAVCNFCCYSLKGYLQCLILELRLELFASL